MHIGNNQQVPAIDELHVHEGGEEIIPGNDAGSQLALADGLGKKMAAPKRILSAPSKEQAQRCSQGA